MVNGVSSSENELPRSCCFTGMYVNSNFEVKSLLKNLKKKREKKSAP